MAACALLSLPSLVRLAWGPQRAAGNVKTLDCMECGPCAAAYGPRSGVPASREGRAARQGARTPGVPCGPRLPGPRWSRGCCCHDEARCGANPAGGAYRGAVDTCTDGVNRRARTTRLVHAMPPHGAWPRCDRPPLPARPCTTTTRCTLAWASKKARELLGAHRCRRRRTPGAFPRTHDTTAWRIVSLGGGCSRRDPALQRTRPCGVMSWPPGSVAMPRSRPARGDGLAGEPAPRLAPHAGRAGARN